MKKYIFGAVFSIGLLVSPAFALAAGLTTGQANSLIAVVQAAPGVPASAFVGLITSFSNITTNQANSLIAVVQAALGVPASAFVDLLISFTSDTQSTTPVASNQTFIKILYPTGGMTFTQGQPMTISWEAVSLNANYTLSYFTSYQEANRVIGTFSPSQAHCGAPDACYISWTPPFSAPNLNLLIKDNTSNALGDWAAITIAPIMPQKPVISYISSDVGKTVTIYGSNLTFGDTPTPTIKIYSSALMGAMVGTVPSVNMSSISGNSIVFGLNSVNRPYGSGSVILSPGVYLVTVTTPVGDSLSSLLTL